MRDCYAGLSFFDWIHYFPYGFLYGIVLLGD
jgi:hypothetical protein